MEGTVVAANDSQTYLPLNDPNCPNSTVLEACPSLYVEIYGYQQFYLCFNYLQGYMTFDELLLQERAKTVIYGVLLNIVCVVGIIGNILSYITMRSREYRGSTTAIYLQVLMIADSLYLLGNFIYYGIILGCGVGHWMVTSLPAYSRIYLTYILIDIFRNCSVLLTLVVTTERYICVCHSLKASLLTPKLSKVVSAITVAIVLIYETPRFFILEVEVLNLTNCDGYVYNVEPSDLMPMQAEQAIGIFGFIIFLALPLLALTILTVLLLRTVKRSEVFRKSMRSTVKSSINDKEGKITVKSNETNTTVILLSVVLTSIICSVPNTVLILLRYTLIGDDILGTLPGSISFYIAILLLNVNSAANVLLFCFFGKKFRRVFKRVFIKSYWGGSRKTPSYRAVSQTVHTHVEHLESEHGGHEDLQMEATTAERE